MHVAILGAPQSGKTQLAVALTQTLNKLGIEAHVSDDVPWQQRQSDDLILLCGLDLAPATAAQTQADQAIRQGLQDRALSFQVVYGEGPARLTNALFALAQQALAKGFTQLAAQIRQPPIARWSGPCESCGDADCEHQLFSRLLSKQH